MLLFVLHSCRRRADKQFISVVFSVFALGERVIMAGKAWHRERLKALQKAEKELREKQGSPADKVRDGDVDVEDEESIKPGEAEAGVLWFERWVSSQSR